MQPYFFPYAQQIRHIGQCDRWVVFDTPKFTRHTWITRNRVADRNSGTRYLTISVRTGASRGSIADAALAPGDWRTSVRNGLRVYDGTAPHYGQTVDLVERCLAVDAETIADLNTHILRELAAALGIGTPIERLSALELGLPDAVAQPQDWGLLVSKALDASVYSNAPGGRQIYDADYYRKHGVELEFYEPVPLTYATPGFTFTPDLSIIDALMWLGTAAMAQWCRDR